MKFLSYTQFINESRLIEGGNAVTMARPINQIEVVETYEYVVKTIFPLLGLTEEFAKPIGSFKKKTAEQTSGDIDIAVSIDRIAGVNGLALPDVLDFIETKLKSAGYMPSTSKGFQQTSIGVPVSGKQNNGVAQVDLMLTDNLEFSAFMYYSPDFTKAESKYKGLYRNILLMSVIGSVNKQITKQSSAGEVEEYKSYVLRLNQGIVSVTKSFVGKKGNLTKIAQLLKDQDKFVTNTPKVIAEIGFGPDVAVQDIMTFESIWNIITSSKYIHKDKLDDILKDFKIKITSNNVPFPTECVEEYPQIFK